MKPRPKYQTTHRLRVGAQHAHYAGGLVDGAWILQGFGDLATELLIRSDGEEGLFRAYHRVDFLAPLYAGDFLELRAEITRFGDRSRRMLFSAWKIIAADREVPNSDRAALLRRPILVCEAEGTCVVLQSRVEK